MKRMFFGLMVILLLLIGSLSTARAQLRDVAVINVTTSKTGCLPMPTVGQDYSMSICVTVENQGDATETFNLAAYFNGSPIIIQEQWLTLEQMEIFWSMGDVNRDGYIDDYDGNLIQCAYGTIDGDADINDDGLVDLTDFTIWTFNYVVNNNAWTYFGLSAVMASQTTVTLPSGNSMKVTFIWNADGVAKGNYTISAYAEPLLGEIDTGNNEYTDGLVYVGIPGDLNADDIVDIYDAVLLAGAAGSMPCELDWNPNADINGDGIVDIFDAVVLAGNV